MPHKLSEAQRRVLEAMADGAELTRKGSYCRLRYTRGGPTSLSEAVANDLVLNGYIRAMYYYGLEARVVDYAITPAGRAALQQSGVGD